ncbi:Plexin domain-containing protein 2 [Nymphon striatum]|nr:Plexin domain-containing protein 2 [Nymphon striatum]
MFTKATYSFSTMFFCHIFSFLTHLEMLCTHLNSGALIFLNVKGNINGHHIYYNSTIAIGGDKPKYWIDLDSMDNETVIKHEMLSNSHRKASTIRISFQFPIYGHLINNITIATGGFLYVGTFVHSWLAATQYIAPLMANFDASLSNDSTIKYADNGTFFVVQWENMILRDQQDVGVFTFQVTLKDNGDIIMSYLKVPIVPLEIESNAHPVKVGLSDAFIIQSQLQFMVITSHRRNTIYEYHRVDLKRVNLTDNSYIFIKALPTCLNFHDCETCISADIGFNCLWCDNIKHCSTGTDRKRQQWMQSRCVIDAVKDSCSNVTNSTVPEKTTSPPSTKISTKIIATTFIPKETTEPTTSSKIISTSTASSTSTKSSPSKKKIPNSITTKIVPTTLSYNTSVDKNSTPISVVGDAHKNTDHNQSASSSGVSVSGLVSALIIVALIIIIVGWIIYAYKNPHTMSGQLLIKYRPSQWRSRDSSARYSASSMHM